MVEGGGVSLIKNVVKQECYSRQIELFKHNVSTNFDTECSLLGSRCSVTARTTFCPPCVKGPNNGYEGDFKSYFPLLTKKWKTSFCVLLSSYSISSHDAFENADLRSVLNACHVSQSP